MTGEVEPFRVDVDEAVLDDLHRRLALTRFPDPITGTGWEYGTSIDQVRELVEYWRDGYDWRAHEARLNELDAVHDRDRRAGASTSCTCARHAPDALPLFLMHGWPGSFVEFLRRLIPAGCSGRDFHVVVPSLPGYGFSEAPTATGLGHRADRGGRGPS